MMLFRTIGNNLLQTIRTATVSDSLTCSLVRSLTTKSQHPGYRSKCASEEPRCSEKSLQEKKDKGECETNKRPSMWLNPECCLDPCPDIMPRFDDLYYKPSDKAKRKYTQTWNECPDIKIAPKKICCFQKVKLPPMEKRKKTDCPKTACAHITKEDPRSCAKGNKRCVKIRLPCCLRARDPPKCSVNKSPANCRKICTPYPAFSECKKPKARLIRPIECTCLYVGPICP
ncbi:uncharacterized protein LOC129246089 [Anastrepha obliqua]|uniref:uncharacterized protein LOC129246089 n=1 Tax=Anastrepha obliqua TaxID=95512 RepID=UPI002409EE2B|nr:uncharacterized protein LOC129246089 [Anastrepha obliqua]